MQYVEQEESYTSYAGTFSGRRVHRGLYRASDGRTVNADLNGAANILRKSSQNFDLEGLSRVED